MLRTQTVQEGALDLIKALMSDEKLEDFNLASLHCQHRNGCDKHHYYWRY